MFSNLSSGPQTGGMGLIQICFWLERLLRSTYAFSMSVSGTVGSIDIFLTISLLHQIITLSGVLLQTSDHPLDGCIVALSRVLRKLG